MVTAETLSPLLARCAQGDEKALEQLYKHTAPQLFALVLRMLRRRDWAEEVMQECYVRIWQHAGDYSAAQSQPLTWMSRIVRNHCIDWLRKPQLEVPDVDDVIVNAWADEAPGPMSLLSQNQESKRIAECLKRLESVQRQVIAMAFFDDLSHSEIAARLAAPLGTVKSWCRRGLEKLKGCLA
ncbi:RNA polymerase sigma factor [Silvimonas soli]|uniref:RNA polymerase sigma factor n=1 Tax=Silvimonas soli TaxID=2980100 RepID=UPI0024B3BDDA|nr:sigma-70 family RNA polymerase sigma factor [Silvimonas soli]